MGRYKTYVIVFTGDSDRYRYVTSIKEHHVARWDKGKEALSMSEDMARDIVYGLACNGFRAGVIKHLQGVKITN